MFAIKGPVWNSLFRQKSHYLSGMLFGAVIKHQAWY